MKFFDITIFLLIINTSFQDDCIFQDGQCKNAEEPSFDVHEKICDLNITKDGCTIRNVKCDDFDSAISCSGVKLSAKHKICLYNSEQTPKCYETFEECIDVSEQNNCNGYSPDSLTRCVWNTEMGSCTETKCESTDKNNCGSYIPVDTSMQCSLDETTNTCKEVSKPNKNNKSLYLKLSLLLFISLIILN